jgi:hypothetical protein
MSETPVIKARLEELRAVLRAEEISYGELAELQGLAEHIDPSDVELLEAAGVEENPPLAALRRAVSGKIASGEAEPIVGNPALTKAGREFALANMNDSIVARVALCGYVSSWPVEHVRTAIEVCNAKGGE